MGKMTIVLNEQVEKRLRECNRKKGDMSKIINEALAKYLLKEQKP